MNIRGESIINYSNDSISDEDVVLRVIMSRGRIMEQICLLLKVNKISIINNNKLIQIF